MLCKFKSLSHVITIAADNDGDREIGICKAGGQGMLSKLGLISQRFVRLTLAPALNNTDQEPALRTDKGFRRNDRHRTVLGLQAHRYRLATFRPSFRRLQSRQRKTASAEYIATLAPLAPAIAFQWATRFGLTSTIACRAARG